MRDRVVLFVYRWPEKPIRVVAQLAHGLAENAAREVAAP
jgi:hypothetical protein